MPTSWSSIPTLLSPSTTLVSKSHLTTLWAGYGSIYRLQVRLPGSKAQTSVILKVITPPRNTVASEDADGDDAPDEGHIRKLISYSAESWFYHNLSDRLQQTYSASGRVPKVAKLYRDILAPEAYLSATVLALEDLATEFPYNASHISAQSHVRAVIRWLARFHAAFFGNGTGSSASAIPRIPPPLLAKPSTQDGRYEGIWAQGGYWYLATRTSENEDMLSSGEWTWLEPWVEFVDGKLWPKGSPDDNDVDPASYLGRTILHGDTKSANILFSKSLASNKEPTGPGGVEAALYDFQYVGHGLGVVDLIYFLGTSVRLANVGEWQRYYYDEVVSALQERGFEGGVGEWTWEVFLKQFDWAVVDWCRFGAGWGGWGNWRWVVGRAQEIVEEWEKNK